MWDRCVYIGGSAGKESTYKKKKKKNPPAVHEMWQEPQQELRVQSLGQEDPLEEGMTTHSSVLAWEIPWTEEPGRL